MTASTPTTVAAEEKARKQKKLLAVLSVVLLGAVGFQLPKLLGGNPVAATTAPSVVEPAPATGDAGAGAGAAGAQLPDTDRVVIEPQSGQLVSFGLFKSKDPFVQQLSTVASPLTPATPTTATEPSQSPFATTPSATTPTQTTPSGAQQGRSTITGRVTPLTTTTTATPTPTPAATLALPTTPASTTPAAPATTNPATPRTTPASTTPASTTPASTTPASTTRASTTPAAAAPAPTSVGISTNGACEIVPVKGTFPGSEDIFRVISIAKDGKSVKIGVVGGAYDSGQGAATLKQGEKLTLVNTAEGTRYVLLLKAHCDVDTQPATQAAPATTTTTAGTTAVAPPPSSATTPIVTDSLDTTTPTDG